MPRGVRARQVVGKELILEKVFHVILDVIVISLMCETRTLTFFILSNVSMMQDVVGDIADDLFAQSGELQHELWIGRVFPEHFALLLSLV